MCASALRALQAQVPRGNLGWLWLSSPSPSGPRARKMSMAFQAGLVSQAHPPRLRAQVQACRRHGPEPLAQPGHTEAPTVNTITPVARTPPRLIFTFLFSVKVEFSESYCLRRSVQRLSRPIMALCYDNGMLAPPSLADRPPDLANNYAVAQRVSVAWGQLPEPE